MLFDFIEAPEFTKRVSKLLDDDDYAELQDYLNNHPEGGTIVPGSGGVRKLRWGAGNRGKRGGLRVIYFLRTALGEIWLLALYDKTVQENIQADVLKQMKEAMVDEEED